MRIAIIIVMFCLPIIVTAQFRTDTSRRVNYLAIPIIFRTPETGWAYGLSTSANFKTTFKNDSLTRTSVITALAIFSQREQNIQGIDATIYFPKEKYILYFQSSHSYFPDKFWGLGQLTGNEDEEKYVFEQVNVSPHIKRKFGKRFFIGVLADYQNIFKVNYISGGIFDSLSFYGKTNYYATGFGFSASYDTRNSTFWPTKGVFAQTQFTTYNRELASSSSYSFNKWMAEVRMFIPLFKGHTLAGQVYNYSTFGETPFRSMAAFGGQGNMRGFYQGRFRDNSMYSVILEYRAHIIGRLSAVAFGGIGDVYTKFKNINTSTLKYSFGGGLRLSILEKENLNLRMDYGYSDKYNSGFYFTIGECF